MDDVITDLGDHGDIQFAGAHLLDVGIQNISNFLRNMLVVLSQLANVHSNTILTNAVTHETRKTQTAVAIRSGGIFTQCRMA